MHEVLTNLSRLEGVCWVILTGQDGLIVASAGEAPGEQEMGEDLKAALAAAIYGTIQRAIEWLGVGQLCDTIVQTDTHCLQVMRLDELLLIVVAERRINVGLVRLEMQRSARRISNYVQRHDTFPAVIIPPKSPDFSHLAQPQPIRSDQPQEQIRSATR